MRRATIAAIVAAAGLAVLGVTVAVAGWWFVTKLAGSTAVPAPPAAIVMGSTGPAGLVFVGKAGVDATGYPYRAVDPVPLRRLLQARRYDELTEIIERLQAEAERDVTREYWASDAVLAFELPDPALGLLLDEWVGAKPRSFAPHAARCAYESALGWQARGNETIARTSRAQLAAFTRHLEQASRLCSQALALSPRSYAAHLVLIQNTRGAGSDEVDQRALAALPRAYRIRHQMIAKRVPQWGGTYRDMRRIAEDGVRRVGDNPRLAWLPGVVEYFRAEDAARAQDDRGAIAGLERALKYGEHWHFYVSRARARLRLEDAAGALTDLDRSLELYPIETSAHFWRGVALLRLKRPGDAAVAFLRTIELDPTASLERRSIVADTFAFHGEELIADGRPLDALVWVDRALAVDAACPRARGARARLEAHPPNRAPAEVDAAVARARREDTFEAYRSLDDQLAQRGRFAEIVAHWTDFLGRHPEDGRAYLERAGTFTHLRDGIPRARRDAEEACRLGVSRGCAVAKQVAQREGRSAAPAAGSVAAAAAAPSNASGIPAGSAR